MSNELAHGKTRRYGKNMAYIPKDFWDKVNGEEINYIQDMKTLLLFDPKMDKEFLLKSLDLIKTYIEKE